MGTGATLRHVLIHDQTFAYLFTHIENLFLHMQPILSNNSLYEKNIFSSVGSMQNKSTNPSRVSSQVEKRTFNKSLLLVQFLV